MRGARGERRLELVELGESRRILVCGRAKEGGETSCPLGNLAMCVNVHAMAKTRSTYDTWVADTFAEVFVSWVIGEATELVLDSFGERCLIHVRVLRLLASELGIEIGDVKYRLLYEHQYHGPHL